MHTLSENIITGTPKQQELFQYNPTSSLTPIMGKKVALDFQGGNITSDAGVLLLNETEAQIGISAALAMCIRDPCRSASVMHQLKELRNSVSIRSPAATKTPMTATAGVMTRP
ncbi:MAG: hypothetical protein HGA97_13125 [Chlorobiaceae bacterium]|nr:hypothetical protein [Chlorobiaceae bacterium]